jgi:hypothetical protein
VIRPTHTGFIDKKWASKGIKIFAGPWYGPLPEFPLPALPGKPEGRFLVNQEKVGINDLKQSTLVRQSGEICL